MKVRIQRGLLNYILTHRYTREQGIIWNRSPFFTAQRCPEETIAGVTPSCNKRETVMLDHHAAFGTCHGPVHVLAGPEALAEHLYSFYLKEEGFKFHPFQNDM